MKRCLALFVFGILFIGTVCAQDIIHKTDGQQIRAKIWEVSSTEIKYQSYDMQTGPIRSITLKEVLKVVYEDGTEEIFNQAKPKQETVYQQTDAVQKPGYKHGSYFGLGVGYGNSYGGIGVRAQARFGGILGYGVHAGLGYFPAIGFSDTDELEGAVLASFGFKFFMYKSLYLNLQFGSFGYARKKIYLTYYDYTIKEGLLYGPSFLVGGDFIFGDRFGFNGALGVSYNANDDFLDYEFWPAIDLGFIFRF